MKNNLHFLSIMDYGKIMVNYGNLTIIRVYFFHFGIMVKRWLQHPSVRGGVTIITKIEKNVFHQNNKTNKTIMVINELYHNNLTIMKEKTNERK